MSDANQARRWLARGLAVMAIAAFMAVPVAAWADEPVGYEPGELVVICDRPTSGGGLSALSLGDRARSSLDDVLDGYDVEEVEVVDDSLAGEGAVVKVSLSDAADADNLIAELENADGIVHVQRNYRYYLADQVKTRTPSGLSAAVSLISAAAEVNDPSLGEQYYLGPWGDAGASTRGADVLEAWDIATADGSVTIAILDTGILPTHEDLGANIDTAHMKDVYSGTAAGVIKDYVGHGTHVAGIAAAVADNAKGIAGASYNANILPIKVFTNSSSDAYTDTVYLIKAYDYLSDLIDAGELADLHVVNMSLGGYGSRDSDDVALEEKIAAMRDEYNVLTVCSGGNGDDYGKAYGPNVHSYPSDYDSVLSVTALEKSGENTEWSDYNLDKDISAPGTALYSTYNSSESGYTNMSGTSMASPLVAGISALLWAYNPDLTVDEAVEAITATANPLDEGGANYHDRSQTGSAGAIDAAAALDYLEEYYPAGEQKPSLRNAEVTLDIADGFVYHTGEAFEPTVTVTYGERTLVENQDYTVTYADNVDVGTAKAVVRATEDGEFRGMKTASFSICNDLSDMSRLSAWAIPDRVYTARAIKPSLQVYYDGSRLVKGADYTAAYENNIYGPAATVTITGIGDYRGTAALPFKIVGSAVDTSPLQTAIAKADQLLASTPVSGVALPSGKWVTASAASALRGAVGDARALLSKANLKQPDFNYQASSLQAAIDAFKADIRPFSIGTATMKLSASSFVYNGSVRKPVVKSVTLGKTKLSAGSDYAVSYSNPNSKAAGTGYRVTVTGKGNYAGSVSATYSIGKAANTISVAGKTVSASAAKLKKGSLTFAVSKALTVKDPKGTLSYAKSSGNSKITVNKTTGKLTVKKGLKKGTYKVKVKVKAAGNANYKASAWIAKTVTVKVG